EDRHKHDLAQARIQLPPLTAADQLLRMTTRTPLRVVRSESSPKYSTHCEALLLRFSTGSLLPDLVSKHFPLRAHQHQTEFLQTLRALQWPKLLWIPRSSTGAAAMHHDSGLVTQTRRLPVQ